MGGGGGVGWGEEEWGGEGWGGEGWGGEGRADIGECSYLITRQVTSLSAYHLDGSYAIW